MSIVLRRRGLAAVAACCAVLLGNSSAALGQTFSGVANGPAHKEGDKVVRAHYLLPFEIVSVHLLVVLIGAAYLARAKRRKPATAV